MCYSLYRCASAHYRIKLDWLICRSCTFYGSELAELCFSLHWGRSTSVTALPCTERCLCSHRTAQGKARRILVTTALAARLRTSFPFPLFKCHRFLFPLLSERRRCVTCKEIQMLSASLKCWYWEANPARTNSHCQPEQAARLRVPCFPWYPRPSSQPPFLRHVCHTPELWNASCSWER